MDLYRSVIRNFYYVRGLFKGDALRRSPVVTDSGRTKTETRPLGRFSAVKTNLSSDVSIRHGDEDGIVVNADENILPLIRTVIIGDDLVIFTSGRFSTQQPLKVSVTIKTGVAMPDLNLSGSGELTMHGIDQEEIAINLRGSGDVSVSGRVSRTRLSLNGSGDIDARRLKSEEADISLTGSGDIEASATEKVSIKLAGSGDVTVVGSPKKVSSSNHGSGDVSIR